MTTLQDVPQGTLIGIWDSTSKGSVGGWIKTRRVHFESPHVAFKDWGPCTLQGVDRPINYHWPLDAPVNFRDEVPNPKRGDLVFW